MNYLKILSFVSSSIGFPFIPYLQNSNPYHFGELIMPLQPLPEHRKRQIRETPQGRRHKFKSKRALSLDQRSQKRKKSRRKK